MMDHGVVMRRHELTDREWELLAPLIPRAAKGRPRVEDRQVINGMVYKIRTGIFWRDLPERYGPWKTVYTRFRRYAIDGTFTRALQQIQARGDAAGDIDWLVQIDSAIVRAHQHAADTGRKGGCTGGTNADDHALGRSRGGPLPISGLTAWQGLFDHGRLTTGQTVLIHGAAGGVGSIAVQLAREAGARVIGTGRSADRDKALALGVDTFLDLQTEKLEDVGETDVVFDVIGGDILDRSAALVRPGGTLVTIAMPPKVQPKDGRAVFFVVEPDRARLIDLAQRVRDGRLKPVVGAVRPLAEAPSAFARGKRTPGKTIICVTED
ncbi:IS5 family transposase (plasmid) [Streptomyces sp. NBC_01340]|uniref:IS5 family transposase n=1 Tax=unclassified Streptomyces TaxID=2593676 RepID=UPI002255D55B|nr:MULTISPECIES: IS5 family transposase [unclassified Streptomyces]MCX4460640.1 IS5 family transposase [Streptomyces sp. NBC_01719]MCX4500030.1 IS5 family transposase [Streptomyces sp. NBC_01728]WSI45135.1 IS5 family transposase [Streptomyces sp. NBC_01340]